MDEEKTTILVVDNDPYILESVSSLLDEYGYSVIACENPIFAIDIVKEDRIDIVLTDIKMPVMTGIELLEKIQNLNPEIPVILMTAYAELDMAVDAIKKGAFDFITKPYKHEYLLYTVEKAIKYKRLLKIEKDYKYTLEDTVRKRTQELTDALIIHKEAEEELKLQAQLLNAATDSIFVHDIDGNFIYVNEAAYKSRGYSKDELMGMNFYALDTLEYAKLTEQRIKKLLEKGATTFESAHLCKDRPMTSVEVHACIIKLGGRELVISVARDITERRQRERELGAIFDGIEDGILFIDKDCQILRVNRAILKMFEKNDFFDLVGKKCPVDFLKKDNMCENCPAEKALKNGNVHHAPRISNITNKGRMVLAVSAYREFGANPVGILKLIKDSGALKKGTKGVEMIEELEPYIDQITIVPGKRGLCSFGVPLMDSILKEHGIKNVALGGLLTNICVESTARSAYDRGYAVTILKDCTACKSFMEQEFAERYIFPLIGHVKTHDEFLEKESLIGIMEGGVSIEEILMWLKAPDRTLQDVLELSMQIETNSLDLYIKMLHKIEDENAQKIFNLLTAEEKAHLSRLGKLLDNKLKMKNE